MGKIRTIVIGDIETEEKARAREKVKREQKKLKTEKTKEKELAKEAVGAAGAAETQDETQDETKDKGDRIKEKKPEKESGGKVVRPADKSKYQFPSGKNYLAAKTKIDKNKTYAAAEALKLLKEISFAKFDETVEAIFNVAEKGIKGLVSLPHGTGKQIRVKVADEKLVENIAAGGKIDFDVLVASPAMMPKLAKIAKIIGPKGLMPNPKTNTISEQPEELVKKFLAGQLQFKTETDFPIIHTVIGKVSFTDKQLEENLLALIKAIGRDKIKSAFIKNTMGPVVRVQV